MLPIFASFSKKLTASSFNSFWDATDSTRPEKSLEVHDFQFLLGCYSLVLAAHSTRRQLSIPFGMLLASYGDIRHSRVRRLFQFLLGCYASTFRSSSTIFWSLSIPFGMLLYWIICGSSCEMTTFNSFWDATPGAYRRGGGGRSTFNSFWDATGVFPNVQASEGWRFQFLLGCYVKIESEKSDWWGAFNSFWDATGRVREEVGIHARVFQFLLGCYGYTYF